jgi:hypothetical protein
LKDSQDANKAKQRKGFVQVNLEHVKKPVLSTNRAFYGLKMASSVSLFVLKRATQNR